MNAICASSYDELLDAMRETAEREKKRGIKSRALDHIRHHNGAISPVASLVNCLGPLTRDLGPDADIQAALREAAERHEQLAKVLWSYANEMRPVRLLEAAE